jgi:hypothetical protein
LRLERLQILGVRAQEHVVDEHRVPRVRRHEPHRDVTLGVRSGEDVAYEQLRLPGQKLANVGQQLLVLRLFEWLVYLAPPDVGLGTGFAHHELVAR